MVFSIQQLFRLPLSSIILLFTLLVLQLFICRRRTTWHWPFQKKQKHYATRELFAAPLMFILLYRFLSVKHDVSNLTSDGI